MGLWHSRVIDTQKFSRAKEVSLPPLWLSRTIAFSSFGALGILSVSHSSQHHQYLYENETIKFAVDGQIDNINSLKEVIERYQSYGPDGLYGLEGAFSIILYDEKKQTTLLFRSFLTGNPLYFAANNNVLTVSSNPVYLLRRPDLSGILDDGEISRLFSFDFSNAKGNIFSELTVVKSGEIVIISPSGIDRYKKALSEIFVPEEYGSDSEMIDRYRSLIEQTVQKSLHPTAEHGIMLSSGMDSSTIAVFAKQQLDRENRRLGAYSWTLPNDPQGDESEKIKALCKALDMPLKLFNGESFGPFDMLNNLLLLPDTPYSNPYWAITGETYRHAADDGIGVLLNGGYGDMLYGGRNDLVYDMLEQRRFDLFFPELYAIIKKTGYYRSERKIPLIRKLVREFIPEYVLRKIRRPGLVEPRQWLSERMKVDIKLKNKIKNSMIEDRRFERFALPLSPYQTGHLGLERYLSNRYGIKMIDPYMNTELINFTLHLPSYMTYRKGTTKYFAREAMKGLLPESVRLQPRVGILSNLLIDSYHRNREQVREMLLDDRSIWKEYIDDLWMEERLNQEKVSDVFDIMVIWQSLNIQQWQKAIKPGGSLYEGTFMQNTSQGLQG